MGQLPEPLAHTRTAPPRPGPLYPDRCLECPEILTEVYGGVRPLRCMHCLAADRLRSGRNGTLQGQ